MRGAGLLDSTRAPQDSYLPAGDDDAGCETREAQRTLEAGAARGDCDCGGGRQLRGAACVEASAAAPANEVVSPLPAALPDRVAELLFLANSPTSASALPASASPRRTRRRPCLRAWRRRTAGRAAVGLRAGRRRHPRSRQRTARVAARAARLSMRTPEGGSVVLRRTERPLQPQDRIYGLRLDDGQWSFAAEAQPKPALISPPAEAARRRRRAARACRPADGGPASPHRTRWLSLPSLSASALSKHLGLFLLPARLEIAAVEEAVVVGVELGEAAAPVPAWPPLPRC